MLGRCLGVLAASALLACGSKASAPAEVESFLVARNELVNAGEGLAKYVGPGGVRADDPQVTAVAGRVVAAVKALPAVSVDGFGVCAAPTRRAAAVLAELEPPPEATKSGVHLSFYVSGVLDAKRAEIKEALCAISKAEPCQGAAKTLGAKTPVASASIPGCY